jgi:predicted ATP-grasp superfamily ATP-dependent carboligase
MHGGTILITGARAPVALEWARQWQAAGWRVLAADSMPRPLASWSKSVDRTWLVPSPRWAGKGFVQRIAAICHEENVQVVMPVCEEVFVLSQGRGALPEGTRLWAPEADVLEVLHDKHAFIKLASDRGLPVPLTRRLENKADVQALEGDWFLKPCYSRFAVSGRRWRGAGVEGRSGQAWLACQEISPVRPWVAQEFLSGEGWCAYGLVESGRVLIMSTYPVEWTAGPGACVAFSAQRQDEVEAWVEQLVAGTDWSGQLAFDFVRVPGRGVLPLECNPRGTSGLHLLPGAAARLAEAWRGEAVGDTAFAPEGTVGMLSVPMLLYGLPQSVRTGRAQEWLQSWRQARDVTSAAGDRAPAWGGNAWTLGWFAREARRLRCGLTAATTADLEWNGPSAQH